MSLRGFMIKCHSPSEDSLSVVLDCSEVANYLDFIRELQDALSSIDEKYSDRTQHRRTIKARYVKYVDKRRRIIRFSPYPSAILNRIKYVRARLYQAVNERCVVIQRFKSGKFERNLYLLPYDGAEAFIKSVEEMNRAIDRLNKELESVDTSKLSEVLEKYGLSMPYCPRSVGRIEVELVPFELSDSVVSEWASKSQAVARAIEEFKRKLVADAVNSVKPKLEEIIRKMLSERRLEDVRRRLEELKRFVESIGLKKLAEGVVAPMIEWTEGRLPSKDEAMLWLDGRIKSLIESL